VSGENAIRLYSILFLEARNELSLEELQKVVGAATALKSFIGGLHRGQVSNTIGVGDADYYQIRNAAVSSKECNRTRGVVHVSIAVGHVEYGITKLVRFITNRGTY
jgi:hypothetical protein